MLLLWVVALDRMGNISPSHQYFFVCYYDDILGRVNKEGKGLFSFVVLKDLAHQGWGRQYRVTPSVPMAVSGMGHSHHG